MVTQIKLVAAVAVVVVVKGKEGGEYSACRNFFSRVITSAGTFLGWANIIFWSFSLWYTYTYILHAINNGFNRTEWSPIRSVIIGMRSGREGSPLLKMSCQF